MFCVHMLICYLGIAERDLPLPGAPCVSEEMEESLTHLAGRQGPGVSAGRGSVRWGGGQGVSRRPPVLTGFASQD